MNPVALYDALNCLSQAVLHGEAGNSGPAEAALMEASLAAVDAFPAGSPESRALGVLRAAAGHVTEAVS